MKPWALSAVDLLPSPWAIQPKRGLCCLPALSLLWGWWSLGQRGARGLQARFLSQLMPSPCAPDLAHPAVWVGTFILWRR